MPVREERVAANTRPEVEEHGSTTRRHRRAGFGRHARLSVASHGLLVAFFLVIVVFSLLKPGAFPTWATVQAILGEAAPAMLISVALTVVLVMRDFDLSFGAVIGVGSGAVVVLMASGGVSAWLAIPLTLILGVAIGATNAILVAYLRGPSFIVTLAMGTVISGIEIAITNQATIYSGIPAGFARLGQGTVLGLSNLVWIAGVFALALGIMLEKTELGRYMYATGGNPEAARLAGVRTRELRAFGFVILGFAGAAVGVLLAAQAASYTPNIGTPYLLPGFAAAFLGTAVLRPGEFTVGGTVIGVLFLGTIQTGLTMVNLPTYAINLFQGAILVAAVLFSQLERRRKRAPAH